MRHHMIHKAAIDLSVPYERIIIYLDSAYVERFAPNAGLMDCFASAEKRGYCLMRPDEGSVGMLKDALKRLIREGMSASAAAAECGFVDYSAFHRAFTKTFRVSPGRIKKQ